MHINTMVGYAVYVEIILYICEIVYICEILGGRGGEKKSLPNL